MELMSIMRQASKLLSELHLKCILHLNCSIISRKNVLHMRESMKKRCHPSLLGNSEEKYRNVLHNANNMYYAE